MKYAAQIIFLVDMIKYVYASSLSYTGITYTMLEPYLIFNGRTPHLYTDGNMSNPDSFQRAESIYFFEKYEQPIHLLLHKPSWDSSGTATWADSQLQTTALYHSMRVPYFVNHKMPPLTGLRHPVKPEAIVPAPDAMWLNNE